mmetsp:Transcript_6515/g.9472  ORF Transcript_6515/g.9472 Transcript_6515/m.9472 type:complete len:99 (+) Transcript_6515:280-576(+)|eukprot:CAMPEP_0195512300 /NCGR_PEP_ID=MMETSP0794_2-20130614/4302_1 /TAXON_ID=515487 /ORGANISM="Stephanopyxis turris, Strain CCMP 815" /LENGTH=98 /DNA_ID=CAMNT_0040640043 /DNA_START=249 /DNA_END=545 /DNA_ORIENTATION=-
MGCLLSKRTGGSKSPVDADSASLVASPSANESGNREFPPQTTKNSGSIMSGGVQGSNDGKAAENGSWMEPLGSVHLSQKNNAGFSPVDPDDSDAESMN